MIRYRGHKCKDHEQLIGFPYFQMKELEEFGHYGDQCIFAHSIAFCPDDDIVIGHLDGRVQRFSKK